MKRSLLHIALFLFCANRVNAQEYLIRQFPALDTAEKEFGANLANYDAMIYGFGVHFGPTDSSGSNINPERSFYFSYGGRHKYKITSAYNFGIDYFFEYRNFGIAQSSKKVFGSQLEHKKERYSQITFNIGFFIRFIFS